MSQSSVAFTWPEGPEGPESEAHASPRRALSHTELPQVRASTYNQPTLTPCLPDFQADGLHHHLLHLNGLGFTDPCPRPSTTLHVGLGTRAGHLQNPVAKTEAGQARRTVEPQLVVEGGARRVRVSAGEGAQPRAHRRGLGDLSPGRRGRKSGREGTVAGAPVV